MRLIYSNELKLETSALTGESEPIEYTAEAAAIHISLFDAHNVAFNGSLCLDGEAIGVVEDFKISDYFKRIGKISQATFILKMLIPKMRSNTELSLIHENLPISVFGS